MTNDISMALQPTDRDVRSDFFRHRATPIWTRLLAALIDLPIVAALAAAISAVTPLADIDALFGPVMVAFSASFLYHFILEASPRQATFGKMIFGLQTVSLRATRLTFLQIAARNLFRWLSWLLMFTPYALGALFPQRAMLHDLLTRTRTIVIRGHDSGELKPISSLTLPSTSSVEKLAILLALIATIVSMLAFALVIFSNLHIRADLSAQFEPHRPAMIAIERYYRKNGAVPASLNSLLKILPADQKYNPEDGSLEFVLDKSQGSILAIPTSKTMVSDEVIFAWVCVPTNPGLVTHMPKDCKSPSMMALQLLKEQ